MLARHERPRLTTATHHAPIAVQHTFTTLARSQAGSQGHGAQVNRMYIQAAQRMRDGRHMPAGALGCTRVHAAATAAQCAGSCSGRSSLQMADTALKAGCAVLTIIWNMTCRGRAKNG